MAHLFSTDTVLEQSLKFPGLVIYRMSSDIAGHWFKVVEPTSKPAEQYNHYFVSLEEAFSFYFEQEDQRGWHPKF